MTATSLLDLWLVSNNYCNVIYAENHFFHILTNHISNCSERDIDDLQYHKGSGEISGIAPTTPTIWGSKNGFFTLLPKLQLQYEPR